MSRNAQQITFGADPEFFFLDINTARPFPSVGLVGGTKESPRMVDVYGLQEDNVMAEFTVPPSVSARNMVLTARGGVDTVLASLNTTRRLGLLSSCWAEFDMAELDQLGPQAYQFGCSPDFDAYNGGAMFPRVSPDVLNLPGNRCRRFAGGHLHIGYKSLLPDVPEFALALLCDITVGVRIVAAGEQQHARRGLYGMAGRHRPTSYGVEYRTPSNMWLYNKHVAAAVIDGLSELSVLLNDGERKVAEAFNEVPWQAVQSAINSEDSRQALELSEWFRYTYINGEG